MRIRFIGTGNCATGLARLAAKNKHQIVDFTGRNLAELKALAAEFDSSFHTLEENAHVDADINIIAISDSALKDVVSKFNFGDTVTVHTAGAVDTDVFKGIASRYGILYPLQSITREQDEVPPIPFLIEGSDAATLQFIREFASTISSSVTEMNGDKRLRLHTAAVIVNNFTNYLYSAANEFCEKEQVEFNLLVPLIEETATRIRESAPQNVQTGPAKRRDIMTIDKHLKLLNAHPKLRTLYLRMSDSIMNN